MLYRLLKLLILIVCVAFITASAEVAVASARPQEGARAGAARRATPPRAQPSARGQAALAREVRHELVTLPFYDVFDWLEGEARPGGVVHLRGQVVRPTTKSDAEARVKSIKGVTRVVNEIEVLPVSPDDDRLRVALYRAIYNFDSPLFRYATRAVPPIHIIVKNGRATLKGVVATEQERDLAYMAARGVPGLFEVTNELRAEREAAR
jgi:hyperosmotically inducible periplasmic protein